MATDALWRIAMRLLRPSSKPTDVHLKPTDVHLDLMSNEDLDHWIEGHRVG